MSQNQNLTNATLVADGNSVLGGIYLVVSVSVMLSNGVIIFVIVKTREQQTPALWMILLRTLFDFLMGFYYLIFVVPSAFFNRFAYSESMIGVASCISTFLTGQTIFNIAMTVIDRYIAITRPLAYTRIVNSKVFVMTFIISIVIGIVRLLLIVLPDVDYYYNTDIALCVADFDTAVTVAASVGIPMITLALILVCSCVIFAEIRRGQRRIQPTGATVTNDNATKFPFMVTLAAIVFCLSYIPFVVSVIWNLIAKKENIPVILVKLTVVALLSNSLWNVLIYTATYRPFRESLIRLFCKIYYRRHRMAETIVEQNIQSQF